MEKLSGKTAVITGASKGIGEAAARHMADLGMNVVLAARSESAVKSIAEDIVAEGGNALGFACDVGDYDQVQALIGQSVDAFGSVDVLVNNARAVQR